MAYEYEIKGVKLNMTDMCQIDTYYEAACTAEGLLETEKMMTKEKALDFGYEVRSLMNKYGYSEGDAIDIVLEDWRKERWIPVAEELAFKIRDLLLKHQMWIDTTIYYNGKAISTNDRNGNFGYNEPDKLFVLENMDPRDYFEYVGYILSMSFEGPLYDAINYGDDSNAVKELTALFDEYGLYYELGNAWNLSLFRKDG